MSIKRSSPALLGLLFIASSSFGQAPVSPPVVPVPPPVSMATFDQNLAAYARSIISTVSPGHTINVWHWETRQDVLLGQSQALPVDPHDQRVINHLKFLQGTFTQASGFGVAGPGIYAAVDPESSSAFGSLRFEDPPQWVLVQFVLNPQVRFFDEAKDNGIQAFSPLLAAQMKQFGCQGTTAQTIFTEAAVDGFPVAPGQPPVPTDPNQVACLAVRKKLVDFSFDPKDRNRRTASAMKYPFGSSQLQGCGPKSKFAFMMFGDDAINFDGLVVFSPELPPAGDVHQINRLMIQEMFVRAAHPIDPWPPFSGLTPEPALDLTAWMRDHILNCVPGRFPEDANPPETPTP